MSKYRVVLEVTSDRTEDEVWGISAEGNNFWWTDAGGPNDDISVVGVEKVDDDAD